jgi:hypothetical protein
VSEVFSPAAQLLYAGWGSLNRGRPTGRCVGRVILVARSTRWLFNKALSRTCTRHPTDNKTSDITDVQAVQPDQAQDHLEPFQRGLFVICRAGSVTAAFAANTA